MSSSEVFQSAGLSYYGSSHIPLQQQHSERLFIAWGRHPESPDCQPLPMLFCLKHWLLLWTTKTSLTQRSRMWFQTKERDRLICYVFRNPSALFPCPYSHPSSLPATGFLGSAMVQVKAEHKHHGHGIGLGRCDQPPACLFWHHSRAQTSVLKPWLALQQTHMKSLAQRSLSWTYTKIL